ncbi:hypothetical protein [Staphylococcus kloosii]|uniref:Lipoprotein n=1 Tax=Staphylococcus kloosii TaxID=29384 RepID=A0A151A6A9_9STAP|nr:hypothetical protein [Staphylococcus kloosii]KYH14867.1 hypothetical protein A0131_08765 [Staphylococcus kloosii]
MKKIIYIILLMIISCSTLSACSNAKKDVQGEWKGKHNKYIIKKDTITIKYQRGDDDVYNYEVVNVNGSELTIDKWFKGEKKGDDFEREKWYTSNHKKEISMYDEEGQVIEAYKVKKPTNNLMWMGIIGVIIAIVYGLYKLGDSEE